MPLMPRILNLTAFLILSLLGSFATPATAQDSGGGRRAGRLFQWLDRNENGTLEGDELQQFPPLKEFLEARSFDFSQSLSFDDFSNHLSTFRAKMERQQYLQQSAADNGDNGPPSGGATQFGQFGGGRAFASYSDDDEDSGSDKPPEKKPAPVVAKPRVLLNLKLPEMYRSKDKDGDGQIGLYEWPRRDVATFRKLDRNGDGFLTPAELMAGASKPISGTATPVVSASSGSSSSATDSSGGSAASSSTPSNPVVAAAELAFKFLDRDKDGSASAEEWQRSLSAKGRFERAGIKVTLPLSKDEFVRLFQQLPK